MSRTHVFFIYLIFVRKIVLISIKNTANMSIMCILHMKSIKEISMM